LGILPRYLSLVNPIWIHAVSVGEAMAVRGLFSGLAKAYADKKFIISTVTSTGNKIAKSIARDNDLVTYLPLDFSFIVRKVIDKANPGLFIIAETEIWPNLISYLYKRNIPVVVVNGRISDNSFKGYMLIKFLLRPILNKVALFCVQTERDAQRLLKLGVYEDKVKVTGNMKFDIKDYTDSKKTCLPEQVRDYTDLKQKLGLEVKGKLFVSASTHPGEEEIILKVYKDLLRDYSSLRLLIAPRHPERAKEVEKTVLKNGFRPFRISQLNGQTGKWFDRLTIPRTIPSEVEGRANGQTVFILDTIGQLMNYYAISDIVFVGGSLVKKGGHNILEPASLGRPVLFGPHMFNFRDIAELFLKNQAAILVHNQKELREKIKDLLSNSSLATQFCQRAQELILGNQGATQKNAGLIKNLYAKISL